ncbi:hypothetical protein GN244_ATG12229 [Phytophthora infestans]|uniref:Uncharacterized protein n=1 Tax=Phytophthora infestans TaxID=4787 RepID=A0A833T0A4_PHYIN|nr:hypothetical protein GN244_ATG12229 [Phytophthora infestans]
MVKGPWLSSEEVDSIELMDNQGQQNSLPSQPKTTESSLTGKPQSKSNSQQALKRPINPVTVDEIAALLAKGKNRGEIMELTGISRYSYYKVVKRLKLEGATTKPSEDPEVAQNTAIPAPQLAPLHPQSAPVPHQQPHRAPAPQQHDITPGPRQHPASALRHDPHAPELRYTADVTARHHNSHASALQQQYAPQATMPQYSLQDFWTSSQPYSSHHAACSTPFMASPSIATSAIQQTDGDYILAALSAEIQRLRRSKPSGFVGEEIKALARCHDVVSQIRRAKKTAAAYSEHGY